MICLLAAAVLQTQHPSQLTRIFPRPTGTNGYEEYLRAQDVLNSKGKFFEMEMALSRATSGQPDPDNPNAPKIDFLTAAFEEVNAYGDVSGLISAGNQKPVFAPVSTYTVDTSFPELAGFKSIAKYQAKASYVLFSEGRTGEGLEVLLDTIRFGRNISQGTVIACLVGTGCDSISMREIDRHLPQLSYGDAKSLEAFASELLDSPSVAINCMTWEERTTPDLLRRFVGQADQTSETAGSEDDGGLLKQWKALSKSDREALMQAACDKAQQKYQESANILAGPESSWFPSSPLPSDISGGKTPSLLDALSEGTGISDVAHSLIRTEAMKRVKYHLLFLTAKIIEFKWTHGKFPASLYDCAKRDEVKDQICGGDFEYAPTGNWFALKSHGAQDTGDITLGMYKAAQPNTRVGVGSP